MELLKDRQPLEFKYHDVVFLVKPHASAGDKMEVTLAGKVEGKKLIFTLAEFNKTLIKKFVIGWRNVTREGEAVPYSFEMFEEYFPSNPKDDVFTLLADFILNKTDIFRKEDILKNVSRESLTGVSK